MFFCIAESVGLQGSHFAVIETAIPAPVTSAAWMAAQSQPSAIDATVTRLMQAAEVTEAGIAVFNDGKVAYLKAYGFRDTEKHLPLTVDSVMTAASFSKSTFALLCDAVGGRRQTRPGQTTVYQYFPKPLPEYSFYRDLAGDPRYKKITAKKCRSPTPAGFPTSAGSMTIRNSISILSPSSRFAYSGEGIELLQLVVETITDKNPCKNSCRHTFFSHSA